LKRNVAASHATAAKAGRVTHLFARLEAGRFHGGAGGLAEAEGGVELEIRSHGFARMNTDNPQQLVILSGASASRSEADAESKDPAQLDSSSGGVREFSPCTLAIRRTAHGKNFLPRR